MDNLSRGSVAETASRQSITNITKSRIYQDLGDLVVQIRADLTLFWATSRFVPNPVNILAQKYAITRTEVLYVMMAWLADEVRRETHV